MINDSTGIFTVDTNGQIKVDYLFDGGWFRGELAVFSLEGMEEYEPGSTEFIKEAAGRALTDSPQGRILIRDETEGAKFSADLDWERDFNTGDYQGVKVFDLTPGDKVALMLVQHTTVEKIWQNPGQTSQFGKVPIFSIPQANPTDYSSSDGAEVVDANGNGAIAFEDVPIKQADRDYNDFIVDIQGIDGNLPPISDKINPVRDWRKSLILGDRQSMTLSDEALVMHLELNQTGDGQAIDSAPEGTNNQGILTKGAKFRQGVVDFDGKNDLIAIQDSPDLNLGTHPQRTISLWFKVDNKNLRSRKQIIYEEGGIKEDDGGLNIYIENGRLYFGGWNGESWSGTYLSTNKLNSNTWHHAVLVLDADPELEAPQAKAFTAYLDGLKIGTGEGATLESRRDNLGIGGLNETTRFHDRKGFINEEHSLAGSIEDVRVYNRALGEGEISFLANYNQQPIVVEDEVVTVENTELILADWNLLANDLDVNGDLLNLTGVDNGINGNVAMDSEGKIIFTPDPGFSGDASFEYTISDNRGDTNTGAVKVTVLPTQTSIPIGTNLHPLADWSPQLPFLNAFKFARRWIPQNWIEPKQGWYRSLKLDWNTGEFDKIDLDENGWVKSLPTPEDKTEYNSVGTVMFRNVGDYPAGKYVVLYQGEGTIEYGLDATKDEFASSPGRDIIDVEPSNSGIWLRITATDPNDTGDYLREIQVLPEEYEYARDRVFNPEFLAKIQPFDTLRFMDWMATNNSNQGEWSDKPDGMASQRPTPNNSLFFGEIASVESMVELANTSNTDPWFTLPHKATDEYVTNFAQYVKDNLNPELQVYVEYSNEVWGDFAQGWWVEQQGKQEFTDSSAGNFAKRIDWYSKRTTEITQIWDRVFAEDRERVIGVMGAQAANLWTGEQSLQYAWADNPLSHKEYGIDAIAIGPYFGRYLGKPHFQKEIESWIDSEDPDLALDNLFAEITQGSVLTNAPKNGALQQAYDWTKSYATLAEAENLDLLTYETSQHLVGINGVQQNQAVSDLFIAANRDPRMAEIYQSYFATLRDLGVDTFINHNDISRYNKYGSWGSLEEIAQTGSPKYNALQSFTVAQNLPPQLEVLNSNLGSAKIIVEGENLTIDANYTDVDLTDYHTIEIDWGDGTPVEMAQQEPLLGEGGNISSSHVYDTPGIYQPIVTVTDDRDLASSKSLEVFVAQKVEIAVNSESDTGDDNIKIAILGAANFNTATIDPNSIRADDELKILLDGRGVEAIANEFRLKDFNNDDFIDLEITFSKSSLHGTIDTEAELFSNKDQIYLFGSSSSLEGSFFLGIEN